MITMCCKTVGRGRRALLLAAALLGFCLPAAARQPPIKQWLKQAGAHNVRIGVDVRPLDGGQAIVRIGHRRPLNPASVIKLLTVWSALDVLGGDYRWRTRFYLNGPLSDGVLDGDLLVVGGGDPKLVIEDLTEMLVQMRSAGLRDIKGNLYVDDSLYSVPRQRGPVFDGQASEPYNVRPNAAMMNFKATKFTLSPVGASVQVVLDPPLANVAIDNQLKLVRGRCRHRSSGIGISEPGTEEQPVLRLQGRYSTGCRTQSAYHAVLNHRQFVDGFFRAGWLAAGGTLAGRTSFKPGMLSKMQAGAASTLSPWFTWLSPRTLTDVVTDINKFSNNVMTRQLLLHLAAASGARPADRAAGLSSVRGWLTLQGLNLPELVIDNASGLSRTNRISAASLSRMLVRAGNSPHATALRDSLPVVGVDGTMQWRLNKDPIAGRAWVKTGSLDSVRSIAGYVHAKSGRMLAVTMLVNGRGARRVQPVQDKLLQWVYRNG